MRSETRDLSIGQALDLGVEFAMAGNHESAIGLFRGVLMHEPVNFEAIERLGSSLFELGRYHEALYWFWRGRKIDRKHSLALTNYGLCLSQLGHPDEGLPDLERAAHFARYGSPGVQALVWNNLGNTLERLGRHADALVALDKGIACNPKDPFPHYNRGIALLRLNRQREAIEALNSSLSLRDPVTDSASRLNHADARYNRGMARLLLGDLKGGFEDYEYRLLTSENKLPNLGLPADKKWTGQPIDGKTLLVHCEQGLGDDIQFFRFLPFLTGCGARILVMAHRATAPLLEGTRVTVLVPGSPLPEYDHWVALMSLPMCLGIEEATIPPPWKPQVTGGAYWHLRHLSMKNVGVCWAGNWLHKNNSHRSIPLEQFSAIFDSPCNFVSLQQMQAIDTEVFAKLKVKHANLSALYLDDFRDTAAVMLNLDLVITVDTAVAHLAGSLGVPTWILLPAYSCDWRWQLGRTDSPWYPSARLWRQPKAGDWDSVLANIRDELSASAITRAA